MRHSALRRAARLATGMIALLTACKTAGPAAADIGSSGPPPELDVSGASGMGTGSIFYRVDSDNGAIVGYVKATPAEAWTTLLATYNDLKLPITDLDASRHTVTSSDPRAPRTIGDKRLHDYLDCGSGLSGPRVDSYDIAYTLVSVVTPAGDSTAIRSSLAAKAHTRGGTSSPPVNCTSTGRLEKRLAQLVSLELGR